jgi:cell division protein DivIC
MNKIPDWLKNKYALTALLFMVYVLFLDDVDVFTIISQNRKLAQLERTKTHVESDLSITRSMLHKISRPYELENFAREKKYFKRQNEDIFVISYE